MSIINRLLFLLYLPFGYFCLNPCMQKRPLDYFLIKNSNIPRQMSQNRFFFSNLLYLLLGVDAGSTRLQGKLFRPSDHFETRHLRASVFVSGIGQHFNKTLEIIWGSLGKRGLQCPRATQDWAVAWLCLLILPVVTIPLKGCKSAGVAHFQMKSRFEGPDRNYRISKEMLGYI